MDSQNPPWTRTAFPLIAGFVVTWLLTTFTPLNDFLPKLGVFGINRDGIVVAIAGVLSFGYHAAAVRLGKRWPALEKWMLGSSLVPVYVAGAAAKVRRKLGAVVNPMDHRTLNGELYMDFTVLLPAIPSGSLLGKMKLFLNWLMLGNDTVGDCVVAGILHAIMWSNKLAGRVVTFSTAFAIKVYSAWTGYVPGDDRTDQGTDPDMAMKELAKSGITDAHGVVHKIAAWFYVPLGNFNALRATIYLFGSAGICFELPESAQDQFPSKKWTVVPGSPSEGGHFVLAVDDDGKAWTKVVTWGAIVKVARQFMLLKSTRWYGFVLEDDLINGKDFHGFNMSQLLADVAALRKQKPAS
jgi:hypothetical protein